MTDTNPDARYTYDPLPTTDSIRLVKIRKSEGIEGIISISLETFRHSEVLGNYKALSYTWGAPYGCDQEDHEDYSLETAVAAPDSSSILCNGRPLVVGKNLREALLQLRKDEEAD